MNLLQPTEIALRNKTFSNGLSAYTQPNCQVSLTDDGYRIYRPPNIIFDGTSSTHTMWGGLKLQPIPGISDDILVQGHTYVILFDIKGQSSCVPTMTYWNNQMGWGGGGLVPEPSNVVCNNIPANFNGKHNFSYKFTINDSIRKICTTSYSSFVAGNEYISYRDFGFAFDYGNTGDLGTDIYISNIQMYDITENKDIKINKQGIISSGDFNEYDPKDISSSVHIGNYTLANEFIEI